jgi:hypothetical protein
VRWTSRSSGISPAGILLAGIAVAVAVMADRYDTRWYAPEAIVAPEAVAQVHTTDHVRDTEPAPVARFDAATVTPYQSPGRPISDMRLKSDGPTLGMFRVKPPPDDPPPGVSYLEWAQSQEAAANGSPANDPSTAGDGSATVNGDAGAAVGADAGTTVAPAAPAASGIELSFAAGIDWTSAYFFRGILQEKNGLILQPFVELGLHLTSDDSPVDLSVYAGNWNSFHGARTDATTSDGLSQYWYEADLYAGASLGYDAWTLDVVYYLFTSPSSSFDAQEEIDLILSFDDSELWDGHFALNPEAILSFELAAPLTGPDRGIFLGLGVRPGFEIDLSPSSTLTIEIPVQVGLSLSDYYQDDFGNDERFGFVDVGVDASLPLTGPDGSPSWTVVGGVHVLFLGDVATEFNEGSDTQVIGRIGLRLAF